MLIGQFRRHHGHRLVDRPRRIAAPFQVGLENGCVEHHGPRLIEGVARSAEPDAPALFLRRRNHRVQDGLDHLDAVVFLEVHEAVLHGAPGSAAQNIGELLGGVADDMQAVAFFKKAHRFVFQDLAGVGQRGHREEGVGFPSRCFTFGATGADHDVGRADIQAERPHLAAGGTRVLLAGDERFGRYRISVGEGDGHGKRRRSPAKRSAAHGGQRNQGLPLGGTQKSGHP